jgi:hypothetical protein
MVERHRSDDSEVLNLFAGLVVEVDEKSALPGRKTLVGVGMRVPVIGLGHGADPNLMIVDLSDGMVVLDCRLRRFVRKINHVEEEFCIRRSPQDKSILFCKVIFGARRFFPTSQTRDVGRPASLRRANCAVAVI